MTREEAINHLKYIAERRRTFHFGGQVREAEPDDTDRALALAIEAMEKVDALTTELSCVLEVGTENTDDYYPYCVMSWHPENLYINRKIGGQQWRMN